MTEFNLRSGSIFGEYDIKELTRGTRCPLAIIGANSFPEKPWHDNVYDGDDDDDDDDYDDVDDDGDARSVKELAGSARHTNRLFPPTPLPTLYTSYECTSYTAVRLHVYLDFVKSIEQELKIQ